MGRLVQDPARRRFGGGNGRSSSLPCAGVGRLAGCTCSLLPSWSPPSPSPCSNCIFVGRHPGMLDHGIREQRANDTRRGAREDRRLDSLRPPGVAVTRERDVETAAFRPRDAARAGGRPRGSGRLGISLMPALRPVGQSVHFEWSSDREDQDPSGPVRPEDAAWSGPLSMRQHRPAREGRH